MTIELSKGANTAIPGQPEQVTVVLDWTGQPDDPLVPDACVFLLDGQERALSQMLLAQGRFTVQFAALPPTVSKLVFALGLPTSRTFSQFTRLALRLCLGDDEAVRYEIDLSECSESALIVGELYRHQQVWKLRAVGQGFIGGLAPLAERYGAELPAVPPPPPPPPPLLARQQPTPVPAQPLYQTATPVTSPDPARRSRAVKLLLTGATGAAAVLLLTQCQRNDQPRYQYTSLPDCVADWDDARYCDYEGGYYYAPTDQYYRSGSSSSSKTKKITGKLVSASRGGFGKVSSLFSGGGS